MASHEAIEDFIARLSAVESSSICFNPYNSGEAENDQIRRSNLKLYLNHMFTRKPSVIIVGEAPGYRGCHWTGIPISSEVAIMDKSHIFFSQIQGLCVVEDVTKKARKPYGESTATVMWKFVDSLLRDDTPLFWNSFPFHPHKMDDPLSNRTPKNDELEELSWSLTKMFEIYPSIKTVIALGRKAEKVLGTMKELKEMGLSFTYVRHPSQGGKNECEKGLKSVLGKRKSENDDQPRKRLSLERNIEVKDKEQA
jgi:hypothetical protein